MAEQPPKSPARRTRPEDEPLIAAAQQALETELLFGGEFLPSAPRQVGQAAPASVEGGGLGAMTREQKAQILSQMDVQEVRGCNKCRLSQDRTQTVFGEGDSDADLVFIGEGPGEEEDRTGRPFVGRAGELLTTMIKAMGLRREQVYICNLVKCRPPGNRVPAADEADACWPYLLRQLQTLEPKVIVTLGNPATQRLLDTRVGITRLRGLWQKLPPFAVGLGGVDVMPTFHPAFVLRQYTPETRRKVWSDLQQVMDRLGIQAPKSRG